jgi:hypothetical protein
MQKASRLVRFRDVANLVIDMVDREIHRAAEACRQFCAQEQGKYDHGKPG